jgi:hypothetical protein
MSTINPASDLATNPLMSLHVDPELMEPVVPREPVERQQRTVIVAREEIVPEEVTQERIETSTPQEYPTDSHELAQNHEGAGAAEVAVNGGNADVKDLGWDKDPEEIPSLFSDYTNDELWTLIRRFNQVNTWKINEAENSKFIMCDVCKQMFLVHWI